MNLQKLQSAQDVNTKSKKHAKWTLQTMRQQKSCVSNTFLMYQKKAIEREMEN